MTTPRPRSLPGQTYAITCACGRVYVTCNDKAGRLFEVFIRLGKAGGCAAAVNEGAAVLISRGLRSNLPPEEIVRSLSGINCHLSTPALPSCLAAVSEAIKSHLSGECNV